VRDELVPFEIAGGAGRRFFRNAGRTRRRGLEAALSSVIGPVELASAASANDFEFVEFSTATADFSGKTIPGAPRRFGELSATWNSRPIQVGIVGRFVSSIIVDDANTARAPGYEVLSLRARGEARVGRASVQPGIALENLIGRKYVGAVSVNAAGGRYYEPAPVRTVVGSLAMRF
jgi:iron complex outermembrane recepter protein